MANHLNDIAKDNPELPLATCRRWLGGATPQRRRLPGMHRVELVVTGVAHDVGGFDLRD